MRTTLDIDDDVLLAAKELAEAQKSTAGKVLSELARKALGPSRPRSQNATALLDVHLLVALFDPMHISTRLPPSGMKRSFPGSPSRMPGIDRRAGALCFKMDLRRAGS